MLLTKDEKAQPITAGKQNCRVFGSRKLWFHEETLSSAERTQFAWSATSLTGETLAAIFENRQNYRNMKKFLFIVCIVLLSCNSKKDEMTAKELESLKYNLADIQLADKGEKLVLLEEIQKVPADTISLILRDYYSKTALSSFSDLEFFRKLIDTLSLKFKLPKTKIASIIYAFKYDMLTREEVEQGLIEAQESSEIYDEN